MQNFISPKQVARAIGVSESSLKRWCDRGILPMVRTAGGHRRLAMNAVLDFIRRTGQPLVEPEVLGLPPATGQGQIVLDRAAEEAADALIAGDEVRFHRMVFDLYLSNHSAASILDDVIAEAFHSIGSRWSHGVAQVYQERRAVEICTRVLTQLRMALPSVVSSAPMAIGGAYSGDPYSLPTAMVDIALREVGWRAESLGTNLPADTLIAAINDLRPRLFWLSVSAFLNVDELVAAFNQIMEAANRTGASVIVGGRSITPELQQRMINARHCSTFRQTAAFAQSTWRSANRENSP